MIAKNLTRIIFLFLSGGLGYYLLEVGFRGHSHWTMGLCGGVCLVGIYFINLRLCRFSYVFRAVVCSLLITSVEFLAGCILNLWLKLGIWDYSSLKFNILGQISLLFSLVWFVLSLILCVIITKVSKKKMPA